MKRAEVAGIRMELPSNTPVLLLKIEDSDIHVPVWIGAPEASAIALMAEAISAPRPLTHDLILDVAAAFGRSLERVEVVALKDDVFESHLVFDDEYRIDARTSDAVALAIRAEVDIFIADSVVEVAGMQVPDEAEDEVERFREFLDQVSADDFEEPEP